MLTRANRSVAAFFGLSSRALRWILACLTLAGGLALAGVCAAWADDPPPADPPATEATPAESVPVDAAPVESTEPTEPAEQKPVPQPGPKAEEFQQVFGEWKKLLENLRELKTKYAVAEPEEIEGIRTQYADELKRGRELLARLRAAGLAAYLEAPNQDRELERMLIKMCGDDLKHDRYAAAAALAETLIDNGCNAPELNSMAGVAAFVTHDFDKAERLLKAAMANGTLNSEQAFNFLAIVGEYKKLWEEEQKIRAAEAEADDLPRVRLKTDDGDVVLELFENEAPGTVGNFVSLVEKGFYDGLPFHRVLDGFMAQGGDPNGDGSGGPGYNIFCECYEPNHRKHFTGSIAMAKTAARNTGGSQFYITFAPVEHLNGRHTVFGRVIEGMDVLPEIQRRNPENLTAAQPTKIIKAEVIRKRDHKYVPRKVE